MSDSEWHTSYVLDWSNSILFQDSAIPLRSVEGNNENLIKKIYSEI
jgi:hypothetical protein